MNKSGRSPEKSLVDLKLKNTAMKSKNQIKLLHSYIQNTSKTKTNIKIMIGDYIFIRFLVLFLITLFVLLVDS